MTNWRRTQNQNNEYFLPKKRVWTLFESESIINNRVLVIIVRNPELSLGTLQRISRTNHLARVNSQG
ncbi:hypothetical protein NIES3585_32650 [Nodularia sp. NIES-3585]|nr:hypothetical protein NIES3585_32650 [Nodularia sp. NIES-3585]